MLIRPDSSNYYYIHMYIFLENYTPPPLTPITVHYMAHSHYPLALQQEEIWEGVLWPIWWREEGREMGFKSSILLVLQGPFIFLSLKPSHLFCLSVDQHPSVLCLDQISSYLFLFIPGGDITAMLDGLGRILQCWKDLFGKEFPGPTLTIIKPALQYCHRTRSHWARKCGEDGCWYCPWARSHWDRSHRSGNGS